MDVSLVVAIVSGISAIITSLIVYSQNTSSKIADKNSTDFRELITSLREELTDTREERDKAIEDRDSALQEKRVVEVELSMSNGVVQDQRELIDDYRSHLTGYDEWRDTGSKPPPPDKSWRLKKDIERFLRESGLTED